MAGMLAALVAFVGVVVALSGATALFKRFFSARDLYLLAWALALLAFAISFGGQLLGGGMGYDPMTFRLVMLGGGLLGPLWLAWGCSELVARGLPAVFTVRLSVSALSIVVSVVLLDDPVYGSFDSSLPAVSGHYMGLPKDLLTLGYVVAAVIIAIAFGVSAGRRGDRGGAARFTAIALAAGGGVLCLGSMALGASGLITVVLQVATTVLLWIAGTRRAESPDESGNDPDDAERWADEEDGDELSAAPRRSRHAREPEPTGEHPYQAQPDDTRVATGQAPYGLDSGDAQPRLDPGAVGAYGVDANGADLNAAGVNGAVPVARQQSSSGPPPNMCGFIAIFTLQDGAAEGFDRLANEAVRQARESEPDTLVFACHRVPSAPQQRIFYEVYRDRTAYEDHERLPHVQRFRDASASCVLATNIIELKIAAAKVAPIDRLLAGAEPAAPWRAGMP